MTYYVAQTPELQLLLKDTQDRIFNLDVGAEWMEIIHNMYSTDNNDNSHI